MNRGFTLVEILVVVGILLGIFAIGYTVDSSGLSRQNISSEQSNLVSVLQKARSRAMNNIDHVKHGVHIAVDKYVIFQGSSYSPSATTNEDVSRNSNIVITGVSDIVFDQLSGETSESTITLTQGALTRNIEIEDNGLIDW